ncbi:unnamed protein product, partial [Iphiclides podalirius]
MTPVTRTEGGLWQCHATVLAVARMGRSNRREVEVLYFCVSSSDICNPRGGQIRWTASTIAAFSHPSKPYSGQRVFSA